MLLEFEDGSWIEIKGYVPYKAGELIARGRVSEALPHLIINWSADVPINAYTCSLLKGAVVEKILEHAKEQMKFISSFKPEELRGAIMGFLNGARPADERFAKLYAHYFQMAILMTDHKGNLHILPYDGGLYDQPWDFVYFMLHFKPTFVEWLAKQNESRMRSMRR